MTTTWPTSEDFEKWASSQEISVSSLADRLPFALAAALEVVQDDVHDELMPDDDTVPQRIRLAVLVLTHRLLIRPDSPNGVIGFGEFAIRVSREDPDYRMLMARHTLPGFA